MADNQDSLEPVGRESDRKTEDRPRPPHLRNAQLTHFLNCRSAEDRSGTTSQVGEVQSADEEGRVVIAYPQATPLGLAHIPGLASAVRFVNFTGRSSPADLRLGSV